MKLNFALWGVMFVLSFLVAGFLPAILLTALAVGCSGAGANKALDSSDRRKQLY